MKKAIPIITVLLGVLVTLAVYVWLQSNHAKQIQALSNFHIFNNAQVLPEFDLIDENNQAVNNAQLKGKWSIINFGYTFCPDICPTNLADASIMMRILAENQINSDKIQSWFITIDPDRDTQDVIKKYTKAFHPDLLGVTGDEEMIEQLASRVGFSFQVQSVQWDSNYYLLAHSDLMVLVNPNGEYAGYILPPYDSENMATGLKRLVEDGSLY